MNTGKPIRVVLVDDSAMFRERIATLLSAVPGVEIVGQASEALSGLAFSQALRPDVVFLDIGLPGPSGIELLKAIKLQNKGPVVIMLTNHNSPQMRAKCFDLGAEFYFYKPDEFESAIDVCRQLAETKGRTASNEKSSEDKS
jgi:DNA-binding NarL/FixJ family response regulator